MISSSATSGVLDPQERDYLHNVFDFGDRVARELLPALDNFDRALAAAESQPENRDHHLTDGIRLVQNELLAALARVGIEPDSPKGKPFDPHCHEAIAQQPVEGTASGTIVEVYSQGYRYRDDVLRPAKVVVAA